MERTAAIFSAGKLRSGDSGSGVVFFVFLVFPLFPTHIYHRPPKAVVVWLTFLLPIRDVPHSNFFPETDILFFRGFSQSVCENAG
jgi:hypothetical protein